jgi:hypothetical protein
MNIGVERAASRVIGAASPGTRVCREPLPTLKATGHHLALLINFNVPMLSAGIRRVIL